VLTTIPANLGNLDLISTIEQVGKALAAIALQGFSIGNIVDCTSVIPEIDTRSTT
jgi:hypothetical protein